MRRRVGLTQLAQQDLDEIHAFLLDREGAQRANKILDALLEIIATLETQAERGHLPPELDGMGVVQTLELHYKPYRILYQFDKRTVNVFLVADGRRNFLQLISRRMVL